MNIVILDGYTTNPGDLSWDGLARFGDLAVYDHTQPEEVIARIGDAPIIITSKTVITAEIMAACPQIRYIGVLATGYNMVDLAEAKKRGIVVTNIPAYSTQAVAQHVFALLLELCNRVGHHNRAVQEGRWASARDFCFWDYPLMELAGKTMGIIGYGRIGQATAAIAKAFGMKVLCCRQSGGEGMVTLEEVLRNSDVISLHCPLTDSNAGFINAETIAKMKTGVLLINTARGGLINEADLRAALLSGKVQGAAVDVAAVEPIRADHPLLGLDNCIMTPHIAWASQESRQRLMDIAAENVCAYLSGTPIHNVAG